MSVTKGATAGTVLGWASRLRFPYLFAFTLLLFLVDLLIPDFIPVADELILGLMTLLFGTWKKRRRQKQPDEMDTVTID